MESLDSEPAVMLLCCLQKDNVTWRCSMSLACFQFKNQQFTCDEGQLERLNLEPFLQHEGPHNCAVVCQVTHGHSCVTHVLSLTPLPNECNPLQSLVLFICPISSFKYYDYCNYWVKSLNYCNHLENKQYIINITQLTTQIRHLKMIMKIMALQ